MNMMVGMDHEVIRGQLLGGKACDCASLSLVLWLMCLCSSQTCTTLASLKEWRLGAAKSASRSFVPLKVG